ncbi:MAG: nucleoside 2-deoxyribosyltransferase [Candidatus Roizmanbacteria bacterium]|nr:nucleoside 2-deoxyribosyltransferase [Candidatus Roizmanbacteria bacterium]
MAKKKTITLCASASSYARLTPIITTLRRQGIHVLTPVINSRLSRTKTQLIRQHFSKIRKSDAILVANYEKKGFQGYIGGNVLMEMALAFALHKKIYILHTPDDTLPITDEIHGLQPIFLNGDLSRIATD